MLLVKDQYIWTSNEYCLEIMRKCGKWVEAKYLKVLGAYRCRSHRGKTDRRLFLRPILKSPEKG